MPAVTHYPLLTPTALAILASAAADRRRSIRRDAATMVAGLRPPLRVLDAPGPLAGGWVIAINHYVSRRVRAWWLALAVTAALDREIHWVMSSAWTYADPFRSRLLTPLSTWLFVRLARTYGFTSMPPMPPRPHEVEARARAVRAVLRYAAQAPEPLVGLAPEGADSPGNALVRPPAGVGRFLAQLARRGLRVLPAGVFEHEGALTVRFGAGFDLRAAPREIDPADRVMAAIAACLPENLRGAYAAGG